MEAGFGRTLIQQGCPATVRLSKSFATRFKSLRLKSAVSRYWNLYTISACVIWLFRAIADSDVLIVIQALFILIAPALFAATIYMILGRIIEIVDGERHSVIRLKWLTKIFVTGDCVSFFVQAIGGGIQSGGTLQLLHIGEKIIVTGLLIQILSFGIFLVSAILFHYRINVVPTSLSSSAEIPWRQHMHNLYLTSGIILVRSVFRVVEYLMGNSGWLLSHEYTLYIFDTILMLSVVVIFLWQHPGILLLNGGKKLDQSSATEFDLLESQ